MRVHKRTAQVRGITLTADNSIPVIPPARALCRHNASYSRCAPGGTCVAQTHRLRGGGWLGQSAQPPSALVLSTDHRLSPMAQARKTRHRCSCSLFSIRWCSVRVGWGWRCHAHLDETRVAWGRCGGSGEWSLIRHIMTKTKTCPVWHPNNPRPLD